MKHALCVMALVALVAACGEKPQTLGAGKRDESPYTGTGKAFSAAGWKLGDKPSWESQLKARTQQGQNDYGRMN